MSIENEERALILGKESVAKLIWKFSLPAIAAMAASSLYNIIAGIFIGHLGAYNIAGVGLTAPFMNLAAAFGSLVGVGASVLCAISLGEKNYEKARQILANLIILNLIMGTLFSILGLAFLNPILAFFGASANTIEPAREYMQIILAGNVFAHMYLGLNSIIRVSGYPVTAMNLTFISVLINLILAPVFIFAMDMGVRGAALATVIAQIACCFTLVAIFMKKNKPVYIDKSQFRLNAGIIRHSLSLGSPNFFTNAAGCFIVVLQNFNLLKYGGDLHVGAYSIINRVVFLFFMVVLGFSQGMQPIIAYNFGAKLYHRMWKAFRITLACALVVTTAGCLICELFPVQLTQIFVEGTSALDQELIQITAQGFRIIMAAFWIIAIQVIGANFFASMNQPGKSLFLSLTRQVIFIIPLLVILPPVIGVNGVWWTTPISDLAAALCTIAMLIHAAKKQRRHT